MVLGYCARYRSLCTRWHIWRRKTCKILYLFSLYDLVRVLYVASSPRSPITLCAAMLQRCDRCRFAPILFTCLYRDELSRWYLSRMTLKYCALLHNSQWLAAKKFLRKPFEERSFFCLCLKVAYHRKPPQTKAEREDVSIFFDYFCDLTWNLI